MKYFIYILFFLIAISCDDSKGVFTGDKYDYQLVKSDSIDLELAIDEYGKSYLDNFIKTEDTSLLYRKSRFENSVIVYDWKCKERIKKTTFKYSGPNGIDRFARASLLPIDNKDHYFIGTAGHIYETLGDSVTQHVRPELTRKPGQSLKETDMFSVSGQNFYPPFKYKNSIYAKTGSLVGDLGTDEYFNSSQLLKYDLNTKNYEQLDLNYPEFYHDNCWGPSRLRITYTFNAETNKLVYLFPIKPVIYTYDLEKEKNIDSVFVKNKHFSKLAPIPCSMPTKKRLKHIYTTTAFEKIVYDEYRNVYYMFATLPITVEQFKSYDNPFGLNPFSILVLDAEFNIIAEREFEGGVYFTSEFFVSEEGLCISKYNKFNENLKENVLTFDVFKPQKDENR